MAARRIILAVTNDLSLDQRLHKMCNTLHQSGYEVLLVGRWLRSSAPLAPREYATHRMRLLFQRGKLFYLEYNLRLWLFLLFRRAHIVTANDLDTLLGAWLGARMCGRKLVYDAHELFCEVPEVVRRPRVQAVWRGLERWLLPRADRFCTVNDWLSDNYQQRYGRRPVVVPNFPEMPTQVPATPKEPTPTLLYQGYLNEGRGLELAIDAMAHLPGWQLWLVGPGPITDALKAQAAASPAAGRIRFWGPLPFDELRELTPRAHVGISIEDPAGGANNFYSSPNKLYDYLCAGLPVVVAALPAHQSVVETHNVGQVLHNRTPEELARLVQSLHPEGEMYTECRQRVTTARTHYQWAANTPQIVELYAGL